MNASHQPGLSDGGRVPRATPKVSFGDDDERTGVYRFSFEMHNLTDRGPRLTP
ncbi:MAG: hypothetical protein ACLU9S_19590 [Oscillospiraceae bacterium]